MAEEKKKDGAAPAEGEEGGEEKKGGNNLVLVIGIIAGIILIQCAIMWLFFIPKPPEDPAQVQARITEKARQDSIAAATYVGAFTDPIEVIVNIAGTDAERFLKAAIVLEYDEKNSILAAELPRRTQRYRDMLISYLSSLTLAEVTAPGAQAKICSDILRQINVSLPENAGAVRNVVISNYIIQ